MTEPRVPFELDVAGRPVRGDALLPSGPAPPGGWPWVVLVHGFRAHRRWGFFPALGEALAGAGLASVGYDASGSGIGPDGAFAAPELFRRNTYSKELEDLRAVLARVRGGGLLPADPERGALLGHSRGAGVALLAASDDPALRALCAWACITRVASWSEETRARWRERGHHLVQGPITGDVQPLATDVIDDADAAGDRFDLASAARRLEAPALLVHGDRDRGLPLEEVRGLLGHFRPGRARLEVVAGARHDFSPARGHAGPPPLERAIELSREFLVSTLGGPA